VVTVPAATTVTPEQVRAVIDTVPDPEMPPVSVGDLGMVHDVRVHDGDARVEVVLIPTFSGCPATQVIREEVVRAVAGLEGVTEVDVRFSFEETWTPERITERGRERLREFAIAPPEDRPSGGGCLPRQPQPGVLQLTDPRCPVCGSADTVADSPFGPTPCRSTHFCNDCRNPFEAIKP
jgi:ring-1,2-phenylacetyl-CoA epoxidase subunit PaaD